MVLDSARESLAQRRQGADTFDCLKRGLAGSECRRIPRTDPIHGFGTAVRDDDAAELGDEAAPPAQTGDLGDLDAVSSGADHDFESCAVDRDDRLGRYERRLSVSIDEQRATQAEQRAVQVGVEQPGPGQR
ncbi:MAG: hypothetical protein U1E29_15080 [Coriobacteriia bacterium]|nr:hypothetical protein [Coriobacteriia bacterium]